MRTNKESISLIKRFEGFRSKPYLCPAGVPTIGYGATYYPYGEKVTMNDEPISEEEAEKMLVLMLQRYEDGVERYVTSKLSYNQFGALVSFAYNCGLGAFKSSTLLKRVNNNPNDPDIKYQFSRWNKVNGLTNRGLKRRRKEESELYFSLL